MCRIWQDERLLIRRKRPKNSRRPKKWAAHTELIHPKRIPKDPLRNKGREAPMDSRSELIDSAPAHWLNGCSKMVHYAAVFTIIALTMVIMEFGSILASLWSDDN